MNTEQTLEKKIEKLQERKASLKEESETLGQQIQEKRLEISDAILEDANTEKLQSDLDRMESRCKVLAVAMKRADEVIQQTQQKIIIVRRDKAEKELAAIEKEMKKHVLSILAAHSEIEKASEEIKQLYLRADKTKKRYKVADQLPAAKNIESLRFVYRPDVIETLNQHMKVAKGRIAQFDLV